tara:strand:- start:326 stop:697 length:372 start_codon:yes stop_codon:yes gene_type:complete
MNGVTTTKCEKVNNMFYRSFGYNIVTSTDYLNHGKVELKNWNVSMDYSNNLEDGAWDDLGGPNVGSMFYECYRFNPDVSGWTIIDPRTLSNMFFSCALLKELVYRLGLLNIQEIRNYTKEAIQ